MAIFQQPQFLYRIRPTRPAMLTESFTPQEEAAVSAHFKNLQRLLAEGSLVLAGRTTNDDLTTFGIVIILADDEAAARVIMENDPAVAQGVMSAELFPYSVALMKGQS